MLEFTQVTTHLAASENEFKKKDNRQLVKVNNINV